MRQVWLAGLAPAAFTLITGLAVAAPPAETLTLTEALEALPDPGRYRVELSPVGFPPDQMETLAQMVGDAARGQHFYGAVYAHRPKDGGRTEFSMRSGLHSRDAAKQGALADCEAARGPNDTACSLVGEILPEAWSETMPELSHVAVGALRQIADSRPGSVVVARSDSGDGFEIRAGDDVRAATVEACNTANAQAGLPEDCAVVIDDLAGPD